MFHPDCVAGFQGFFKTCAEYGLLLEFFHQFPLVSGVFELFPERGQFRIDFFQILPVDFQFFFSGQPQGDAARQQLFPLFQKPQMQDIFTGGDVSDRIWECNLSGKTGRQFFQVYFF